MPTVLDFQRLRETLLPEWTKPENASVFDPAYRAPIRTIIKWLGLDDPQQVMAFGTPLETGPMAGGAIEALGKRFPRFAEALKTYTHPGQPPFYSRLEESVQGMGKQVPAPKLLGVVQKGQASAEELAARGVPEFAAQYGNKPIPKEAIAAHLEANPVQLGVKTLGGGKSVFKVVDTSTLPEESVAGYGRLELPPFAVQNTEGNTLSFHASREAANEAIDELGSLGIHGIGQPKYAQYQLPGGTNYRETLITLPRPEPVKGRMPEGYRTFAEREAKTFQSSHFDEPNILVHTRSNERDLPGLGHGTFLEEVQSDWHQQGKAKGYQASDVARKARERELAIQDELIALQPQLSAAHAADNPVAFEPLAARRDLLKRQYAEAQGQRRAAEAGVPDAPFKETWPDLALKHHLVEAAQNPETNWLGFTSGETQAARYDLSKQINEIHYSGSNFKAYDHNGKEVISQTGVREEDLPDLIGKEAAKKLLEQPKQGTLRSLVGQDLKVGGEGMKYFYDTLLPKRLEKIVKPFGGTVERVSMRASDFPEPVTHGDLAAARARARNKVEEAGGHVQSWIVRLTPEMKRRILTEGVPLMTGVAAVGSAQREK